MSRLSISNLKFILFNSDTLALRALLVFASTHWALWTLLVTSQIAETVAKVDPGYDSQYLSAWAVAFLVHGIWSSYLLITNNPHRTWNILCSAIGTIAWTSTVVMLVLIRIRTGTLPLGGMHVTTSVAMWWIFLKDCFRPFPLE
jgi:hypothetical protein